MRLISKLTEAKVPPSFLRAVLWALCAGGCGRTRVSCAQLRSLVSDLQSCSTSNLPCTTTLCFVGSDYGQTNWDSNQQRLTREKTSRRHNLISANIKILASGNLNHRAAVFSLVRLEKLCPAPVSLGDGDKGRSQAQLMDIGDLQGRIKWETPAPGNRAAVPEHELQGSADRVSPDGKQEQSDAFNPNLVTCQIQTQVGLGGEYSVV